MSTSQYKNPSSMKQFRLLGWGSAVLALVLGYLFWIVSKQWWTPSLIIFGLLFAVIIFGNLFLAAKKKAYDLYLAALLALVSPALVIFVAFGFFFSGPPS
ncbi:MAG: hypothetical protein ACTILH_08380 [Corynebacterium casei]|uniref:hypothetical protein n=1 Tax=Corynebacterium casei TaxID=160386 RepID=UPI003F95794F